MTIQNIAVLFGGQSTEYGVSLQSAASVIDHLDRSKYAVIMIGITREGAWFRYNGSTDEIRNDRWHSHASRIPAFLSPSRSIAGIVELAGTEYRTVPVDAIIPVLHGRNGEDGTLQGLLELSGIPFVGCDTLSSAICMDKAIASSLVRAAGIETAATVTVWEGGDMEAAAVEAAKFGFPLYVKPSRSGSSFGITKAYNRSELLAGIREAFAHDKKVVIEQNIDGFEVGCAVLGGGDEPFIAEIDEIELAGGFFDYDEKYSLRTSQIVLPARLDTGLADQVKAAARLIYKTLGCTGLARVDMFIAQDGRIVFNEVNTMPGFTASSRYPNMMRHSGVTYPQLMDRLIELAIAGKELGTR
ncbi:D-alanine--D-serine ligase VanG [Paenibacillus harenae]|uniref:D-alanine--D-serine ligase VanG n=1 Tax=Paenibacillus harenae TaxID=306543 RepID=UPI00278D4AEC|nr:D-alanine--D-serine ligase VanG [Paenibacillus harenae]MDQ0062204.1 D-alanine---D-serine ligase [Paenibacillus harenae]